MTFKELLDSKGINALELSKKAGISYNAVHGVVRGERKIGNLTLTTSTKIARVLGISVDELFQTLVDPEEMGLCEGWNDFKTISILVEDGLVQSGIRDGNPVYPYIRSGNREYTKADGLTIAEYKKAVKEGKLLWS